MGRPKHETCRYAEKAWELMVYVTPGCPKAGILHGVLVSSKIQCRSCKEWRGKAYKNEKEDAHE